ncbi:MAG: DUF5050 domain-containing protein [Caldicoprobacterales bacterium]|jgi:hypothetical protein|nr:DUF5050 domain-containing protein [Clostridiales bacterium]
MKRQFFLFTLVLAMLITLIACSGQTGTHKDNGDVTDGMSSSSEDNSLPSDNKNLMGNTNGNLVNGGRVAVSGQWIYYSLLDGIYRMKTDGTEGEMICSWETNTNPSPLCIIGEWIYYKRFCPFKIKIDGSEQQQISEFEYIGSFRVIDGWMYFGSEYKMKTDGSNVQQINEKNCASGNTVNIVDGWIYYYDKDEQGSDSIFKLKIDGTDKQKIYSGRTDNMIVDGDWIYYEEYDSKDLYKMKTDGSDNQLIVEENKILSLNIDGDWIYYGGSDESGTRSLCKIKTDGSDKQVLYADNATGICIIEDWIYYGINGDSMETLYRIRTDGSDRQVISGGKKNSIEGNDETEEPSSPRKNGHDEGGITQKTIDLNNTYTTRFGEINAISYPSFMFDYLDRWTISQEEVTPLTELVVLKNDRGVEITFAYFSSSIPVHGTSNALMLRVDVSKVADSNFIPGYVQATNHSDLGPFMVAKLKTSGTLDMMTDSDFTDIDGGIAFAVLPETEVGERTARGLFIGEFTFDYSGSVSFTCSAPEGRFTEEEEKEVIAILASFRNEP